MYKKSSLTLAEKDLICEYIYRSMGRVINKGISGWDGPIPQGVSVYMAHPDTGEYEYMYTKDDNYFVDKDPEDEVMRCLNAYGNVKAGGLVFYLHSIMLPVFSKHIAHPY